MDPQDNTFPIPPTDNNGGSTPPPAGQPVQPADSLAMQNSIPQPAQGLDANQAAPAQMPMQPAPQPLTPAQPAPQPQPDWANQAAADASQLPPGADNYSVNSPFATPPATQPTDNLAVTAAQPTPQPQPQPAPLPATTPPVAQPAESLPYTEPAQAVPSYDQAAANPQSPSPVIPEANTLDLSNQPQPITVAPMPPGEMQPGVAVSPLAQMPAPIDELNPTGLPTAQEGSLPTDLGSSYNADLTGLAAQEVTKRRGPLKFILIAVAILALLTIISLAVVFSGRNQRKPAIELNEESVENQTSTTQAVALPEGYKSVARDCYSFGIVSQTNIDFARTACNIGAKFGSSSQYDITVLPVTTTIADLNTFATSLKKGTNVSQTNMQIAGIDAIKIIQTVDGVTQQVIAVIPTDKKYTFSSALITGFAITTTYNDTDSKAVSNNVLKTWQWK